MEEGRRGARERRRVLGELKMRCHVVQGENASPWDEALAGNKTARCELFSKPGVLLVQEWQDKLFCALCAKSPQQRSTSPVLSALSPGPCAAQLSGRM